MESNKKCANILCKPGTNYNVCVLKTDQKSKMAATLTI